MLLGILTVLACTAMFVAVLSVVFYGDAIVRVLVRLGRALRIVAPPPPTAAGPPIGILSADLRRLRMATLHPTPGQPQVRRVATLAAYDDALGDACAALGLPDTLSDLPPGPDREAERLRVEWLLHEQGLDVA